MLLIQTFVWAQEITPGPGAESDPTKAYKEFYSLLDAGKSPYGISLGYEANFASDITIDGQTKDPQELDALYKDWNRVVEFSKVNPEVDPLFWDPKQTISPNSINLNSYLANNLNFVDTKDGVDGEALMRFHIKDKNEKLYIATIHKFNFQEMIRTSLLKKLNYIVPDKKLIQNLELNFSSDELKTKFMNDLKYYMGESEYKKWLTQTPEKNKVLIRHVLVSENLPDNIDLATSPKLVDTNENKRIFRALVAAFNVTHMNTTSLNMLKWDLGRIESGNILLDSPETKKFGANIDDLIWGALQLTKLTRNDWVEIVGNSQLPGCVQELFVEKYIERTKSLSTKLKINPSHLQSRKIFNCNSEVLDGKQIIDTYEEYPFISFAYGNIQNPMTQEEMAALMWSRLYQFGYQALVGVFNNLPYLNTDINTVNNTKINELIDDAIKRSKKSGKNENIATELWNVPFYRAGIIFDRQIVAGNFLGTTNSISKAETLGFRVGGGIFQGIAGILPDFDKKGDFNTIRLPFVQAEFDAGATLTISHIEPVTSVKEALSEYKLNPFKKTNLFREKNKLAKILKPIFTQEEINQDAINKFLNNFSINESIIINLQGDAKVGIGGRLLVEFMQFDLGFRSQAGSMLRTHITRVNKDTIHIYKNNGYFVSPYIFNSKTSISVPILRYSLEKLQGRANTEFFSLSVDPEDPNLKKNIEALYDVLKTGKIKKLYDLQKPYDLKFKFHERAQEMGLLMLTRNTLKQNLTLEITDPKDDKRKFVRTGDSLIKGINYYDYALDAVDSLLYLVSGWNPPLANGYTFRSSNQIGGESFVRSTTYEAETTNNVVENPMIKLVRFYSGFKNKTKKVQKKLDKIFNHYHFNFFSENALNGVDYLFLYQLEVEFNLYPEAINSVLNFDQEKVAKLFKLHHNHVKPSEGLSRLENDTFSGLDHFLRLRKKIKKNNDVLSKSYNKQIIKLINYCDENLTLSGLVQLYGGVNNFYIRPKITGFRSGIEFDPTVASERNIFGNTLGIVRENNLGPLTNQLVKSDETPGIIEGELFIQWIMRRP